ncbi:tagaturonate reductase [Caproiciproducens galactitolivorans]|uniref:Altronate oxidoreductase n=1 Tax=Caproiciproducens galactitolivorans TaxID=642589 RepID=A0A4Z0YDK3_9FIRM|nr:tagaturonate reductase [Caproiciproducens galactitolivorans]QEY35284.1 tagaturonate reductase [Caproiciproducens galactitolivorans]TGJ76980.1 altronate oxidoreductase [Caproiciproducens galactitolivorans]
MKRIEELYQPVERPIKIVQFGEGNFLRAFVDYMTDVANALGVFNGNIAVVKPIPFGSLERFQKQKNLYTVSLRGRKNGEAYVENRVITSISRCVDCYEDFASFLELARLDSLEFVVSNTTEAGIAYDPSDRFDMAPQSSYPGKLTRFLYERFHTFSGSAEKGLVILPVELIENNGRKLKECVLQYAAQWELKPEFKDWLQNSCVFCSTLVDRIVTGYPKGEAEQICEKLGYQDELLDTAEPFGLWVIEGPKDISERLPFPKAGLPVVFTENQKPYRERKVRILNGAHTATVLAGYLMGRNIVRECMHDPLIRKFMEQVVLEEIVPTVKLPHEEAVAFAQSVFERFDNPFVDHALLSISLNSVSKWKARILPTFKDQYRAAGKPPKLLTFSFAALMAFYQSDEWKEHALIGRRNGESYEIHDDESVLNFFRCNSRKPVNEFVRAFASETSFWGENLTEYNRFEEMVCGYLSDILEKGMAKAMEHVLSSEG